MARENNTDSNSLYGNHMFVNTEKGDFTIEENSPAFKLGLRTLR